MTEAPTIRETVFRLPIRDEDALRAFVERAFGVRIPDVQVCPRHSTPWRAFADAYFGRSPISVWKGSRGFGGKSFTLALLGLTEALTLGAEVSILGGSGQQSLRVHEALGRFWASKAAPRTMLEGDPTQRETRLRNGATIRALLASSTSVRGPHPQRLRCDEVDEMELSILDAATGQTMRRTGPHGPIETQTVLSSTHQYPNGTMTEVRRRARERGWPVYEWCYRETLRPHGWLEADEVERKRGEVSREMWEREYEGQEPSADALAIDPDAVERMFRSDLGVYKGGPGEYLEIEEPIAPNAYAHGADWARKRDWTVVDSIRYDVSPARRVAWQRVQRRPWPEMVAALDERLERFGGTAAHDATGLGDVVDGYLEHAAAEGVIFTGRARAALLSAYIAAIEAGKLVSPRIEWAYLSHRQASVDDVYGAGHLPDDIAAGSLAWSRVAAGGLTSASQIAVPRSHLSAEIPAW